MNATKITITLVELGIMSIAAIGCASNAVSADGELNIESAPVIGAPSDPSGSQGIAVGEINLAAPGTSTSTPVNYPILDPGIGNGEIMIPVELNCGISDGAGPIPVPPIELPVGEGLPTYEEWLASQATTSPVQLPEIGDNLRPLPVNPIEPDPPVNLPVIADDSSLVPAQLPVIEGDDGLIAVQLPVIEVGEVIPPQLCMSTMAVQLPIEFHFGQNATPTGFDGINSTSCMFPEKITKITVVLTDIDGGPSHVESWGLPEASSSVSFPLPANWLSMATRAWLGAGEYNRTMTATGVSGETYDLVAQVSALGTVTILADYRRTTTEFTRGRA